MRNGMPDKQIKAIAMAMVGAILAAVATMFVPVAMLEAFTGATGLSELVPAAAAPLGDTARAIIAFAAGAFTLAVLSYPLLRQEKPPRAEPKPTLADDALDAISFKDRFAQIALPKMPWAKGDDDITELSDLPKLRNNDAHPDAPPRRPLSAHQDLPVLNIGDTAVPAPAVETAPPVDAGETIAVAEPKRISPAPSVATESVASAAPVVSDDDQPTLAEMVAQLEAAVADRQQQLAELEAVAAQLGAGGVATQVEAEPEMAEDFSEPVRTERPPLEAVPTGVKDDDMDSALAAALATLHRMNGTGR